ncbi:RNA-directed DNA polymerase, eukaryota [Tanacetum coccineum]
MTKGETSTPTREQNIALQCSKLNESNYTTWAIMMETILKAYGLWETLEATEKVDERKIHTTKAMILTTLPEDILMQVAQYETAKEVWESIKVRYIGEDRVQKARLQTLRSKLETLKMKNNETVSDFAGKLGSIRGKVKSLGSTLKDKTLVRKLLNSLPKKFLPIVASIEQYSEIDEMSFEEAMGRIITFEERIKSQDEPEENYQNKLLMARSSNQNHGNGRGRNLSKGEKGCGTSFQQSTREQNKNKMRCYECGDLGHFARECTKWKKKNKEEKSHLIYETDDEPTLLGPGLVPNFSDDLDDDDSDVDSKDGDPIPRDSGSCDDDGNMTEIPETIFEMDKQINDTQAEEPTGMKENHSEDPFNIYPLLNKQKVSNGKEETSVHTPEFPPGYTPPVIADNAHVDPSRSKEIPIRDTSESVCSGHFKKSVAPRSQGSILNLMEELIKVGQTMGYNMDGCLNNLTQIIESQGEAAVSCWGNLGFDYVHSDSVGNSGGILCVWDPYSLRKISSTVSDYFVMIRGVWLKTGNNILIISVYAPHDLKEKRMLWDYLNHVIQSWNGEVVIMGDFNEVRLKSDRFGSVFNVQGANAFNSFIANAGLEEVPLGGSSFTWCHKSATKMSKLDRFLISENLLISCPNITAITLDRYLSDHRPILLRESWLDYGPIPFRFYHHWIEVDGFSNFVVDTWKGASGNNSNAMCSLMMKLKFLKVKIREWNKKNLNITKSGKDKFKEVLKTLDAKIDNGDGSAEKVLKRSEVINSIQEIDKLHSMELAQKAKINWCVEGDENSHFFHGMLNKRPKSNEHPRIRLMMLDEVRTRLKVSSIITSVAGSLIRGVIRKGCNSTFIVLIPKIPDANLVKDFRPISLIGSIYKIIAKILANRLVGVLDDIINEVQSAFIADRQILDVRHPSGTALCLSITRGEKSSIKLIIMDESYESYSWRRRENCFLIIKFSDDLDDDDSDVDSKDGDPIPRDSGSCDDDGNMTEIPETIFEMDKQINDTQAEESTGMKENHSEDPFNIYPLLNKQKVSNGKEETSVHTPEFPPGYTPPVIADNAHVDPSRSKEIPIRDTSESVCSGHFKKSVAPRSQGLAQKAKKDWVKELCIKHKVNCLALQETKMESIDLFNIRSCWGNLGFDYVHSDSVGNSGGILCVWDPYSLRKISSTVSDYFVMIRGVWLKTGNNILIISVYVPHDLKEKRMLWDYLNHVIQSWNGEVVIMGDFNEVRLKSDRFGSVFNVQGANTFNSFIANAGLEEVPLSGSSFTWCHKSATKMSKLDRFLISKNLLTSCPNITAITLDRYLSDHRPILLRESWLDYGLIPFRFYHHWIEVDGFSNFVVDTWKGASGNNSNAMCSLMMKLKFLKVKIREWNKKNLNITKSGKAKFKEVLKTLDAEIDNGDGSAEKVLKRSEVINSIQEIDKLHSMELAQKAKINWCVEGDENSHFFHGMLNKRRSQMNIRGIMIDGVWIEDPYKVKSEFYNHFSSRFAKPVSQRALLNMQFPNTITLDQQMDLEREVTKEELKKAVWDCGTDKSPGPDGFTFGFFRRFWSTIEDDVFEAVKYFFNSGVIPKGCNSTFIVLIPKIPDANLVKDFRPISLIGSIYKIIAKILANRLVGVLDDIINEVQSAFIADRQILDGPFILNEMLQWCKLKKKHSLIFKVDFEKAFNSIRWDFLDDVLKKFGFGDKWCN